MIPTPASVFDEIKLIICAIGQTIKPSNHPLDIEFLKVVG